MWRTCWAVACVLGVGCGFSAGPSSGDDVVIPDGQQIMLVDDTAADFSAHDELTDGTVATRGAIEADAFILRAWHARAFGNTNDQLITSASSFDAVTAALTTLKGESFDWLPSNWGIDRPHGLSLDESDHFAIVFDGEIYLPSGDVELELEADDHAIFQIALDGATWSPSIYDDLGLAGARTVTVAAPGWYRVRGVFEENSTFAFMNLYATGPDGVKIHIDANQTRSRVTSATGLQVQAFKRYGLLAPAGLAWAPTIDADFGGQAPKVDLGIANDNWSLRYTGQLRIDEATTYAFTAEIGTDATDAFRIWVDGAIVAEKYGRGLVPNGTVDLQPGWHDLTVDYAEAMGNAHVRVAVTGGDLTGAIPSDRLRPVTAFGLTASTFDMVGSTTVIADATATAAGVTLVPYEIDVPPSARTASVDWVFDLDGHQNPDVLVELVGCATASPASATLDQGGLFADLTCAGELTPRSWTMRFTDSVQGGLQGFVHDRALAVTFTEDPSRAPYATHTTFISTPDPTPDAIGFAKLRVDATLGTAILTIEVRTGDADTIASAPWVTVISDHVPEVAAHELVQYKLSIDQDGWQNIAIDRVSLTYVVP